MSLLWPKFQFVERIKFLVTEKGFKAGSTSLQTILYSYEDWLEVTRTRVWWTLARIWAQGPGCEAVMESGGCDPDCCRSVRLYWTKCSLASLCVSSLAVMMGSLPAKVWLWEKASRSASQARQPPPRPGPRQAQDAGPGSDHLHLVEQIRDSHRGREDRFSLRHFSTNVYPPWKAFQGYHSLATVRLFPPASASQPKTTASDWSASARIGGLWLAKTPWPS